MTTLLDQALEAQIAQWRAFLRRQRSLDGTAVEVRERQLRTSWRDSWKPASQEMKLRHRGPFADLERWQIAYLPVYALWAALVVVAFPPLFGYR
jgi:hypothetical protein